MAFVKNKSNWVFPLAFALVVSACSEAGFNPLKLFKKKKSAEQNENAEDRSNVADSGQTGKWSTAELENDQAVKFHRDIVYAKRGNTKLEMDIAIPAINSDRGKSFPVIVFVHGGGFVAGDRHGFYPHLQKAAHQGFAAAAVDYRLADGRQENRFPAAVKDVAAAVRWLKENADTYNIDPERVGIYGGSAGGNLALMTGLATDLVDMDPDRLYPEQNSRVKAVVNFCGPTDYLVLLDHHDRADPLHVRAYLGGKRIKQLRESARKASPVYYANKNAPPVLTVHGTDDSVVPYESALRLDNALKKFGTYHRLVPLPGGDHPGLSKVDYRDKLDYETYQFFKEKL